MGELQKPPIDESNALPSDILTKSSNIAGHHGIKACNVDAIYDAITLFLHKNGLDLQNLLTAGTDNASVMTGEKRGVCPAQSRGPRAAIDQVCLPLSAACGIACCK